MREWHFILVLSSTVVVIAYIAYAIPYIRNKKIFIQRGFIMMRILLSLGTNLAILVVLTIAMRLLGLDTVLAQQGAGGLDLTGLLIIAGIIGMSGSFISLAMSKWMAKRMIGAQVIDQLTNPTEAWLVDTLSRQARQAGIGRPEVAIYDSPDLNAFATGMNRNSALVAVSTGLLRTMRKEEVEAVLGHEVSHVANGDMVTLALIQGVVNIFVFFLTQSSGMW
jgi:heat shock protein HtpX